MRMDLNKTVGGTRLTLYANLPKGQKITTYARFEAEQAASQSQQPKPHHAGATAAIEECATAARLAGGGATEAILSVRYATGFRSRLRFLLFQRSKSADASH